MSKALGKKYLVLSLSLVLVAFSGACARVRQPAPTPRNFDKDVKGDQKLVPGEFDPDQVENWFTKGPDEGVEGVNAEAIYKKSPLLTHEVIVAVIDNGVDIDHEDLKGKIWTNAAEANGLPGVDDDHNGYVDDVHGWNYLGSIKADGTYVHLDGETLETVREKVRLAKKKLDLESKGLILPPEEERQLAQLTSELEQARKDAEAAKTLNAGAIKELEAAFPAIAQKLGVALKDVTEKALQDLVPGTPEEASAREQMIGVLKRVNAKAVARLYRRVEAATDALEINLNESLKARETLVGDDPENLEDTHYGNPDVKGANPDHGTHVAGIIAANRNNDLGVKGIAENVKIMALRVVPNGDERDKDIARAVRYAADNGANIINMSFGKKLSPQKKAVDDAFMYAAQKGVLIVHAAGNDAQNTDEQAFFPNRYLRGATGENYLEIPTWVEVGASARYKSAKLTAPFSNYGQNGVDVFAPGLDLKSSVPGGYAVFSGTSMACPAAAGTAALLWSTSEKLTAPEVRRLLLQSTRSHALLPVVLPGGKEADLVPFGSLSRTGGVLDVLRALTQAGVQ